VPFRDDYFRRILEELEASAEERIAEDRRGDQADTLERLDRALAEVHRTQPELLQMTLDGAALSDPRPLSDRLDELYAIRTALCRRLEASRLEESTVLILIRGVYVGTEEQRSRRHRPDRPIDLLARILRQERVAHLLSSPQLVEAWRVLFELEADRGNWAHAEDYLFHAVRLSGADRGLVERGIDFYQQLLDRPDADIEKGGLTRQEADRARWDLLELQDGA
jgi:hypothetical protein